MATDKKNKKQATLAYIAKAKYKKKPWLLAEFGFQAYREEGKEGGDVSEGTPTFYAQPISIPAKSRIGQGLRGLFAKLAKENPGDEGMEDVVTLSDGTTEIVGDLASDISHGQLAFCDSGNGAWYLFVNVSGIEFVGADDILDVCPEVSKLVESGVVYKTKYRE